MAEHKKNIRNRHVKIIFKHAYRKLLKLIEEDKKIEIRKREPNSSYYAEVKYLIDYIEKSGGTCPKGDTIVNGFDKYIGNNPKWNQPSDNTTDAIARFLGANDAKTYVEEFIEPSEKITGAITIDDSFIEEKQHDVQFSSSDFYTNKQDQDCQWYGIIKYFDIEREIYTELQNAVRTSFNQRRTIKVCAIVQGDGGSGKSTLLRRLAIDSFDNEFITLWIKDTSFDSFCKIGIETISKQKDINYLVIIEDWYRIWETQEYRELISPFFRKTQECSNIRIVIGNRNQGMKPCVKNLYRERNHFKLVHSENKDILDKIAQRNPSWKKILDDHFTTNKQYASPLFILLFVIANFIDKNVVYDDLDLDEPERAFENIIRHDFKSLIEEYPKFIKVLIYYAKIYTNKKYFFSHSFLLKLADKLNSKNKVNELFSNLNMRSNHHDNLRKYIHYETLTIGRQREKEMLRFNHDLFAEKGIGILDENDNNINIDDVFKKEIRSLSRKIEKYNQEVSILAKYLLENEKTLFKDTTAKLKFVKELISKGNRDSHYLETIRTFSLNKLEFDNIMEILFEKELFPQNTWISYLKKYPKKSNQLLEYPNFFNIDSSISCVVLNNTNDKKALEDTCQKIMQDDDFLELDKEIICVVLNNIKDDKILEDTCQKIISSDVFFKVNPEIICVLLNNNKDDEILKSIYQKIIPDDVFFKLDYSIICALLNNVKDDEILKSIYQKIKPDDVFFKINHELICALLNNINNDQVLKEACQKIITYSDFFGLNHQIICALLNNINNDQVLKEACQKIITYRDFFELDEEIICALLNNNNDDKILKSIYQKIIQDDVFFKLDYSIICALLNNIKDDKILEDICQEIVQDDGFLGLNIELICVVLKKATFSSRKQEVALHILKDNLYKKDVNVLLACLSCFINVKDIPQTIEEKINEIINSYYQKEITYSIKYLFVRIHRYPFHSVASWKKQTNWVLKNWKKQNRGLITNVLFSYETKPHELTMVCEKILQEWKKEISKKIIFYGINTRYGDHILKSLAHPELKILAKEKAKEILDISSHNIEIPPYLLEVVDKIINKNEFPKWDT